MLKKIKLKTALIGNAIFSSVSGLLALIWNNGLAELIGISNPFVLTVLGIGLMIFAGTIIYHATRKDISPMQVKLIIFQDLLWVAGSAVILTFQMFGLTQMGYLIVGVIALAVADFAFLQYHGLKNYRAN